MSIMSAHTNFIRRFQAATITLDYNPAWASGAGYFDHLTRDAAINELVPLGCMARSIDPQGRKLLILTTLYGPLAVFERDSLEGSVLVLNVPEPVRLFLNPTSKSITEEGLEYIFDNPYGPDNVQERLAFFFKRTRKHFSTLAEARGALADAPEPQ